jgi:predicted permease
MWYELRLAIRRLLGERLLTGVCIVIVGVGIATSTALFSLTDALLLRPLPFDRPDEIIVISAPFEVSRRLRGDERQVERANVESSPLLRETAFATPGLFFEDAAASEAGVIAMDVSPNFFRMLGVAPIRGRIIEDPPSDDVEAPAVLLGHGLWRSAFGADETVLGRAVILAGQAIRPVAVMPFGIEFPHGANLWRIQTHRAPSAVPNYARLKEGVSVEQARRQFARLNVTGLREAVTPAGAFTIAYLLGATLLVLAVGWVQVGGLLVSRTAGKASGIGIRVALGASRRRLLWEFLAEGAVLAAMALLAAWILVPLLLGGIVRLLPTEMVRGQVIAADWRSFAFACALSATGVVLLAAFPLRILSGSNPSQSLHGRSARGVNLSANRVRTALVVAQLAVTCLLLYVARLALQSLWRVTAVDLGFAPDGIVVIQIRGTASSATTNPDELLVHQALDEIRALAGVASAAAGVTYPTQRASLRGTARLPADPTFDPTMVRVNHVTDDFFATLSVRMVEGRDFDRRDAAAQPVAIVNEALADILRHHGGVLDQVIQVTSMRGRIVGVVENYVDERPDVPSEPQVFFPRSGVVTRLLVREKAGAEHVLPAVQAVLDRAYGPDPRRRVVRLEDETRRATSDYYGRGVLLGALAVVAVVLVLAGVAGAINYATRQRTREIAIHIALGAEPSAIWRRIVGWALFGIAAGALAGVGGGILAARSASALWFGVTPLDAPTAAGVICLVVVTGLLAAHFPAREASRVDPALVLKEH